MGDEAVAAATQGDMVRNVVVYLLTSFQLNDNIDIGFVDYFTI